MQLKYLKCLFFFSSETIFSKICGTQILYVGSNMFWNVIELY